MSCVIRIVVLALMATLAQSADLLGQQREKLTFVSTFDQSKQTAYFIRVAEDDGLAKPLVVSLHTWSGDVEQRDLALEEEVRRQGWYYLFPDFRGANTRPQACGSLEAQQDILDAVQEVCRRYAIDPHKIYLTGVSGGGHMTMLMAGRYPGVWAAASAWVGISDLAAWQQRHAKDRYGQNCVACCGGAPGAREEVDRQYRFRSPLTHLAAASKLPLDLAAGVHDGRQGSVPIAHTLWAFNVMARTNGDRAISDEEIRQIGGEQERLRAPLAGDLGHDDSFGRDFYLRRTTAKARVTIFEGGHEGIAKAAVAWLGKHSREAPPDFTPAKPADDQRR